MLIKVDVFVSYKVMVDGFYTKARILNIPIIFQRDPP